MSSRLTVVIDNGTWRCKAGMAGDDAPNVVFPPVIGRPKQQGAMEKEEYVGDAAMARRSELVSSTPLKARLVTDWDDMERVWHHCFVSELQVDPQQHPALLSEPPNNLKHHREKVTQIMFEKFSTPAFYLSKQAQLSLYASGRTTGLVVDAGEDSTFSSPVFEGYVLPSGVLRVPLGGRHLTEWMSELLMRRGYSFKTFSEMEIVRDIKERLCYVAEDIYEERNNAKTNTALQKEYKLPDGEVVKVGSERFECAEALMQPLLVGREYAGMHETAYNAIMKVEPEMRKEMYPNILFSGGTSLIPGLDAKVQKEIEKLAPPGMNVTVIGPPEREYSVWVGGSKLASLPTFQQMWISKSEYEETGAAIVQRKCF